MESQNQSKATVSVGSADLNQGSTAVPDMNITIGGAVPQMRPIKHTRKKKQGNLYICTWNVTTLSEESHLANLINEIKDLKRHVIGLSEVRRPGKKLVETKEHHLLYHN